MSENKSFAQRYADNLKIQYELNPSLFAWPPQELPVVVGKMLNALRAGTANRDSNAVRNACRAYGIKSTNKAIMEVLAKEGIKFDAPIIDPKNFRVRNVYLGD